MGASPRARNFYWLYLALLGLAGIFIAWYSTATLGPGVGTDGAIQISTADHLLVGKGLTDFAGDAFVKWPPLYPVSIAALSWVSGLDALALAGYLNFVLFGLIIWLGGILLYRCLPDELLWAFIGSLIIAISPSVFSIIVNIGTDPMFAVLCLAFLLAADKYLETGSRSSLIWMACLALLASVQRLPGVTLTAAAVILIWLVNRGNRGRAVRQSLVFAAVTALPLLGWVAIHNYLQNGTLFGIYLGVMTHPMDNLNDAVTKIFHWFVPYQRIAWLAAAGMKVVIMVGLALISKRPDWVRLGRRLSSTPVLASLVFGVVYMAFLVLTINSVDTSYPYYDRYYVVILAPVLILIFAVVHELGLARIVNHPNLARGAVLLVSLLWMVYPGFNFYSYAVQTRSIGAVTYNLFNTRTMQQSQMVKVLKEISRDHDRPIYSNYPAAVWLYTRWDALYSPRSSIIAGLDIEALLAENEGWPGDERSYLVWFLPSEYKHLLKPKKLMQLADLEIIYRGLDGEIYLVQPRRVLP